MELNSRALAALNEHVEREWPREAGGVIRCGGFFPLENLHPDPERHWEFETDDIESVEAVIHSHPDGCAFPSRADMEAQIALDLPHGIVPMTDVGAAMPFFWPDTGRPYLGRPYRHGVTDCYTLLRDWYARERGLELPAVAYEWRWSEDSPALDLYTSWRRRLDWAEVDPAEAQPGDAVLFRMAGSRVANHAGVLLEGGLLLHHPSPKPYDPTCLSRRTPLGRLARYVAEVVRPPELVT
ncbi:MAG: glycoside hydrolase [Holophagales bacterium]|nr:glycoside hydrolase [Holophagales bacterium]MYC10962.1 glycoside hydrolase [Holophagales bacterium]